ncbi:MAG: PDDEXK nuclease domain-containing protein [Myxococcaceae bacterium]|nr:PDDEXK nuclease domain-containing protein [Myxococcaceae bacterium]
MKSKKGKISHSLAHGYNSVLVDAVRLIEAARGAAARSVNAVMTATYWGIGRRIVEHEQSGAHRAAYGEELLKRLAKDLTAKVGRGFSERNLEQMRRFFLTWSISQTPSAKLLPGSGDLISQKMSAKSRDADSLAGLPVFPLPWSHYVRLLGVTNIEARHFYEAEALRGGWTVRQLDRQIGSQFYERTALSKNKVAMLRRGQAMAPTDVVTPEEAIRQPYVLEFLNLKDEYSETELEAALIAKLESFLLELGGDFTFVGRQRRLRVGDAWYRVDLLFFHRRLRCLVVIDLKLGEFTHADAGQMHLYLNYVREHWTMPDENPPVGLILCAKKDHAVAKYALDGLPNKVLAAEYRTVLPAERTLVEEIEKTRLQLERRRKYRGR